MVWAFVVAFLSVVFLVAFLLGSGSTQAIPTSFSLPWALSFGLNAALFFVPIMLFLVLFVRHYEKRNFRSTVSSLGLNRNGIRRSLLWSIVFMVPLVVAILLWEELVVGLFGPSFFTAQSQASKIPQWYVVATIIYLLVNALLEESIGRGYMLDRLMPSHPSGLVASLPAILGVSVLGLLYHVPEYVLAYHFSPLSSFYNLVIVFLSFSFVGLGYVRSRVRNISGPILVHFLLDAVPYLLIL